MDIMEEGNLMDRVRILLQRDQAYYNEHQKVILQKLCPTVIGGFLDFPCTTTFVASKIVAWWEESYFSLFRDSSSLFKGSTAVDFTKNEEDNINVGKSTTAKEFVTLISQSSSKVLNHMHFLSQEALDHADLSVLTGTIGTASLIRNAIWIYQQQLTSSGSGVSLSQELKTLQNMSEALCERLLDLHCRLISLYILQDVDCVNWADEYAFFEGKRSSYTIQMWWLYVQSVREDLWYSMPPKAAEQIFSGILNESLTILTSRYMQAKPSKARSELVVTDLSNLLSCVFALLPTICENGDEFLGCNAKSNVIRDIHIKCHLLLRCLVIRGTPLPIIYNNVRDNLSDGAFFHKKMPHSIESWIIFASSLSRDAIPVNLQSNVQLPIELAMKYELIVFLARAQPDWRIFLKILRMNNCQILYELLQHVMVDSKSVENEIKTEYCNGFLCNDDCALVGTVQSSIVHLLLSIENKNDMQNTLIKVLEAVPNRWASYFSQSQISNQNRPFWIEAIQSFIRPTVKYIVNMIDQRCKAETGEKIDEYVDAMKSTIDCLPAGVFVMCSQIENILPADVIPLDNSVLIQLMAMTLHGELGNQSSILDSLCATESKKLQELRKSIEEFTQNLSQNFTHLENEEVDEIITNHLLTDKYCRVSLKILNEYLRNDADWLLSKLKIKLNKPKCNILHNMFYIGNNEYDQMLTGSWAPQWSQLNCMPLGLTVENLYDQLLKRPEFNEETKLTKQDQAIVSQLKSQLGSALLADEI